MFGARRKPAKNELAQQQQHKKKWQLELEEYEGEDSIDPSKIVLRPGELPQDDSDDERRRQIEQQALLEAEKRANEHESEAAKLIIEEKRDKGSKPKRYEWMSESEDEGDEGDEGEENLLKEMQFQKKGKGDGDINDAEHDRDACTIFVENIPFEASVKDITRVFAEFGSILNVDVPKNEGQKNNKGRAYIEYASLAEAKKAQHHMMLNSIRINPPFFARPPLQTTSGFATESSKSSSDQIMPS
eukprot:TRINITY_DN3358_c0_g1_i1.p1 TRINITY_DN3358_c0_g1~~TRINITY_DN3358_c0_g1_i1.p1  ORF type:complete len:244 (+),score=48.80 TRINITY_DN3358_c0_g1_i1:72-803(+)